MNHRTTVPGTISMAEDSIEYHQHPDDHLPRSQNDPSTHRIKKLPRLPPLSPSPGLDLEFAPITASNGTNAGDLDIKWHSTRSLSLDHLMPPETQIQERREMSKRRSQYYEDVFAYREPHLSARERISRDSMVVADLRTNVIVSSILPLASPVV